MITLTTLVCVSGLLLGSLPTAYLLRHADTKLAYAAHALAIQTIIGLLTGVAQAFGAVAGIDNGFVRLLVPLLGLSYNTGGVSVRFLYEAIARDRTVVVMGDPIYFVLLAIQVGVICLAFVHLMPRKEWPVKSLRYFIIGILVINSALNISWPWWGT